MKWFTMLVLVAFTGSLRADWRDELSVRRGKFPKPRAQTANYEIGWSGVKAAEAQVKFSSAKSGVSKLEVKGGSVGLARVLYGMDGTLVSTCTASLSPIQLVMVEDYGKKCVTTKLDFTRKGVTCLKKVSPPDPKPPKPKKVLLPRAHDPQSALLFFHSLPLRTGDSARLCVCAGNSGNHLAVKVTGREKLCVAGHEWDTIRCDVKLSSVEKNHTLTPSKRLKKLTVWVSDDKDRLLLRAEGEIFLGYVWAEMKSVDFTK